MSLPRRMHLLNTIANPPPTMPVLKSDFLEVISARGYLHQCTDLDVLDQRAADGMITAYVGYDATADGGRQLTPTAMGLVGRTASMASDSGSPDSRNASFVQPKLTQNGSPRASIN